MTSPPTTTATAPVLHWLRVFREEIVHIDKIIGVDSVVLLDHIIRFPGPSLACRKWNSLCDFRCRDGHASDCYKRGTTQDTANQRTTVNVCHLLNS